jgi:hypothetical protein
MFIRQPARHFQPLPFTLAVLGAAFSLWNAMSPANVFCFTSGCALFAEFTVGGVSLWWVGIGGFTLLAFGAILGSAPIGMILSGLGLGIDCLLLMIMLITAPCASCLVVAALLAMIYASFRNLALDSLPSRNRNYSLLLMFWLFLFISNLGVLANTVFTPWPIYRAANQEQLIANVYFSPSCSACRLLVQETDPIDADRINWYPVAENEDDISVIAAMHTQILQGKTVRQAFNFAYNTQRPESGQILLRPEIMLLQMRLYMNQAHVLRGQGMLPMIEYQGVPAFMISKASSSARGENQPDAVPISSGFNRCGDSENCD